MLLGDGRLLNLHLKIVVQMLIRIRILDIFQT